MYGSSSVVNRNRSTGETTCASLFFTVFIRSVSLVPGRYSEAHEVQFTMISSVDRGENTDNAKAEYLLRMHVFVPYTLGTVLKHQQSGRLAFGLSDIRTCPPFFVVNRPGVGWCFLVPEANTPHTAAVAVSVGHSQNYCSCTYK